jgi:predicted  nucleic acid-binding Zn-ribbon protein
MEKQAVLEIIAKLLILQERDNQVVQCQRELDSIPARKKETETWIAAARQALDGAKETLQTRMAANKKLELEIEGCRQQIVKLREQQYQIKSNEEYRALNNEIAHIQKKARELEDQEIEGMEQAELAQAEIAHKNTDMEKDATRIREELQTLETRRSNLEQEVQKIQAERESLAAGIDHVWLARYNYIMDHKKDSALIAIERNACGACHMTLPPQVIHDTRKAEAIVTCSFCGRILYWTT